MIVIARGVNYYYILICPHYPPEAIYNTTEQKNRDCFGGRIKS
ncbi:hypothetical protein CWATWH0005_1894 [Crocosphaera watsonii WH 0005]|uniref:Uncharacterized protein n=1 Tax=Crocosphaera watsonii WH 0005 TaxID=423472 RepID=T2ILX0_CROWT|nr:hypothetical protein CWATWH0005_1894 [Crocosphaera watsonii WH 0005]